MCTPELAAAQRKYLTTTQKNRVWCLCVVFKWGLNAALTRNCLCASMPLQQTSLSFVKIPSHDLYPRWETCQQRPETTSQPHKRKGCGVCMRYTRFECGSHTSLRFNATSIDKPFIIETIETRSVQENCQSFRTRKFQSSEGYNQPHPVSVQFPLSTQTCRQHSSCGSTDQKDLGKKIE